MARKKSEKSGEGEKTETIEIKAEAGEVQENKVRKKRVAGEKKQIKSKTEFVQKQVPAQPEISIGLIGHVDHGKTTLTEKLSGKWTDTHSEEIKRGITIRLGYADTEIRRCPECNEPECFTVQKKCPIHNTETIILRKISLVDAPGHESLMATMLAGAMIIDGALLLVAANEECPQPQTKEHLMALQIIGVKNIVVVQNKIDIVSEQEALENYRQIKEFLSSTAYKDAPIIPLSAQQGINIDYLIQAIQEHILTPQRDETRPPIMLVARSFDINKPGTLPENYMGGVLGGALSQGVLKVGDEIIIRPGVGIGEENKKVWKELKTRIIGLMTGSTRVEEVRPGGTIAVMTSLDPNIVKADALTGRVVGYEGKLPETIKEVELELHLLERVVGAKNEIAVEPIKKGEILMLNVNAAATVGFVTEISKKGIKCSLKIPICADKGSRITISRRIGNRFRLIGYGIIL